MQKTIWSTRFLFQLHVSQVFFSILNSGLAFPDLEPTLIKYQNPREADAMTKIQTDLDETKIILVRTCLFYTGSAYNELGYNEYSVITSRFLCIKLFVCNIKKLWLQWAVTYSEQFLLNLFTRRKQKKSWIYVWITNTYLNNLSNSKGYHN